MASSSKYLVRNLWNVAPVLTTNLVDIGLVDAAFNSTLTRAAVAAFDEYTSIRRGSTLPPSASTVADPQEPKTPARRRRRNSSSRLERAESPTGGFKRPLPSPFDDRDSGTLVTDNDFFFEHQKNRGYRLATEAIANCSCAERLQEDHLVDAVAYYLQNVCGAKPLADVLRSGTGELSIDMWAAVQRGKGAYHADHVHEGALVSGVYYASVPAGSAPLVLRRPNASESIRTEEELSQQTHETVNDDRVGDVIIPPTEGNLILFPPWVEHGVPLAEEQEESIDNSFIHLPRVSFAFNVTSGMVLGNDPWTVTRIH